MFVISCKYNPDFPFIIQLIKDIRTHHSTEKIVVVDSDSNDKTYFQILKEYNVIIEDINNKNWMIGAYWHAYKKYSNEDFYYFMHDSMRVKSNLDYLKKYDLVTLMHFDREIGNFNVWKEKITLESKYNYSNKGRGCYGPIFFCKNKIMKRMLEMKADIFLPKNKLETHYCERIYGFFFEEQGYDLAECSLFGDVLFNESPSGKSGPFPHKTDWQFPVEKFYASHVDKSRL